MFDAIFHFPLGVRIANMYHNDGNEHAYKMFYSEKTANCDRA